MSRFHIPTQKGTEVWPVVTRSMPLVRFTGVPPGSPLAHALMALTKPQIDRYYRAQAQNYSLSVLTHHGTHTSIDGIDLQYLNHMGQETIYVSVPPHIVEEAVRRVEEELKRPKVVEQPDVRALVVDIFFKVHRYVPVVRVDDLGATYRRITQTTVSDAFALEAWINYGMTDEDEDLFLEYYATDRAGEYIPPGPSDKRAIWMAGATSPAPGDGSGAETDFMSATEGQLDWTNWGVTGRDVIDTGFVRQPPVDWDNEPYVDEFPEPPYERVRSLMIFPNSVTVDGEVQYFDTPVRIGMQMIGGCHEMMLGSVTSTSTSPIDNVRIRVREYDLPEEEAIWNRVGEDWWGFAYRLAENGPSSGGPWTLQQDNHGYTQGSSYNMYIAQNTWAGTDDSEVASMNNAGMGDLIADPGYRAASIPCPPGDPQDIATYEWTEPGEMTPIYELVYKPNEEELADRVVITEL